MATKKQSRFMRQQKLMLGALGAVTIGVLVYVSSIVLTDAPLGDFVEGEHYFLLENPRRIRGDKVEIMEFFSYACQHCFRFDKDLDSWVEARKDRIKFVRNPLIASEHWRTMGRAYYTMQQLNILEAGHLQLFSAIHDARRTLNTAEKLAAELATDNITEATFISTFNSAEITAKINRADALSRRFKIATVPNMVVNGKYLVRTSDKVGLARMLDIMDFLLAKELTPESEKTSPASTAG
jgi:thiol:disulfide interchange protein DsbA